MQTQQRRRRRQIGVVGSTLKSIRREVAEVFSPEAKAEAMKDLREAGEGLREGLIEIFTCYSHGCTTDVNNSTSTPTPANPISIINTELKARCQKLQARIPELEAKAAASHRRVEQARAEAQAKLNALNIDIQL